MKEITELSLDEAQILLDIVHPDKNYKVNELRFTSETNQVTFSLKPIIGILYFNDHHDRDIIHFQNTRILPWLYENNYNILKLLEYNDDLTDTSNQHEQLVYHIDTLLNLDKLTGKVLTREEIIEKGIKILNEYYYDI